jgi:hypothetical protein
VNVTVRLMLQAIDSTAHGHTAVVEPEPAWDVDPGQWGSPLTLTCVKLELHERKLDPEVTGDA